MDRRPSLVSLTLADAPQAWSALGFPVPGGAIELGAVRLVLGAAGSGIVSWAVSGIEPVESIDGLPTSAVDLIPGPLGEFGLDHVVALTPDFDRTAGAFDAAGIGLRRVRSAGAGDDTFRQGFRRLGPAIIELVEARQLPPGPARFWGLTLICADLDGLCRRLGSDLVSAPKPAVQPGRRIATLRAAAGLSQPVALMDPPS